MYNAFKNFLILFSERCGHGMAIVNDVIYVLGGTSDDKILESMETYNVETNTWTRICTSIPRPTCYASTVGELPFLLDRSFLRGFPLFTVSSLFSFLYECCDWYFCIFFICSFG